LVPASVTNIGTAFAWPQDFFRSLEKSMPSGILQLVASKMSTAQFSTCFSGIDAAGTSLAFLWQSLAKHNVSPTNVNSSKAAGPIHASAVEQQQVSQAGLMMSPNAPLCLFKDILSFYKAGIKTLLPTLRGSPELASALRGLAVRGSGVVTTSHCLNHDQDCSMTACDVHVASCEASSRDDDVARFTCWASLRRKLGDRIIIFESTDGFNKELLHELFADMYTIFSTIICPTSLGFPVHQPRFWAVMVLKVRGQVDNNSLVDDGPRLWTIRPQRPGQISSTCCCRRRGWVLPTTRMAGADEEHGWCRRGGWL
jgi:hypothetical protein